MLSRCNMKTSICHTYFMSGEIKEFKKKHYSHPAMSRSKLKMYTCNLCNELKKGNPLSLYSTATQNTWRWGLALGNAPDARILRWRYRHVGIIIWRYLTLKFASPPTPNLKFALSPTPTPDASQWNIGGVRSQTKISCIGHVHFIFCV